MYCNVFMLFVGALAELGRQRAAEAFRNSFAFFLLVLLLTLVIYCVPVLIYRFGIRHGAPLETKWKATWVSWIFWICSYTALLLFCLKAGYYDDGDFSVRAGIPDYLCMGINWFLLYFKFGSKSTTPPPTNKNAAPASSVCSKCGAPLTENAKFCKECGEKVAPSGMIVCPSCEKTVVKGKFCPECGHKFPDLPA